jgi:hypothetical protein
MISFDDWSFFESEDDDDTSQEAIANDDPPVKGGKQHCMMCFESSERQFGPCLVFRREGSS